MRSPNSGLDDAALPQAGEGKKITLFDHEVAAIVAMRKNGRTYSCISEEIGVLRLPVSCSSGSIGESLARDSEFGWNTDTSRVARESQSCNGVFISAGELHWCCGVWKPEVLYLYLL